MPQKDSFVINIREKDLVRVLSYVISQSCDSGVIRKPTWLSSPPKALSKVDIWPSLQALSAKGAIEVHLADFPESDNIDYIRPLDAAYEYLLERAEARKAFWTSWRWNIYATIFTALVSSLLGALLARVSQIIWP